MNPVDEEPVESEEVLFCVPPFPPTNPSGVFVGCVEVLVVFEVAVVLSFYYIVTGGIFLFIITTEAMSTANEIALVETVVAKVAK